MDVAFSLGERDTRKMCVYKMQSYVSAEENGQNASRKEKEGLFRIRGKGQFS